MTNKYKIEQKNERLIHFLESKKLSSIKLIDFFESEGITSREEQNQFYQAIRFSDELIKGYQKKNGILFTKVTLAS